MAVANEAVVKRVNYISEMSQNDECFNRRGDIKCSCGCTLMFNFDIEMPKVQQFLPYKTLNGKPFKGTV